MSGMIRVTVDGQKMAVLHRAGRVSWVEPARDGAIGAPPAACGPGSRMAAAAACAQALLDGIGPGAACSFTNCVGRSIA